MMRLLFQGLLGLLLSAALALPASAPALADDFPTWLKQFQRDAQADGIQPATVERAFIGVTPIPKVIELDRKQPEFTLTLGEYLDRTVTGGRVDAARERARQNAPVLAAVAQRYHVPARFILALWGVESDFGRLQGNFSVVAALATLAYDGRRSAYFRRELLDALHIIQDIGIPPDRLRGSWAGAMGQTQFMPSSYRRFAVSYAGTGKPDIWTNPADAFASIANYLSQSGWREEEGWGRAVRLTLPLDTAVLGLDAPARPFHDWTILGVRALDGLALEPDLQLAGLLEPQAGAATTYLVTENFRTILKWNRSNFFAIAVGTLADRIGASN